MHWQCLAEPHTDHPTCQRLPQADTCFRSSQAQWHRRFEKIVAAADDSLLSRCHADTGGTPCAELHEGRLILAGDERTAFSRGCECDGNWSKSLFQYASIGNPPSPGLLPLPPEGRARSFVRDGLPLKPLQLLPNCK